MVLQIWIISDNRSKTKSPFFAYLSCDEHYKAGNFADICDKNKQIKNLDLNGCT